MREVELSRSPAGELEGIPGFGPSDEVETGSFRARFADQPIAHSVDEIFEAFNLEIPPSLELYRMFKVWLIPHHIGIIRQSGQAEILSAGVEVRYQTDGETCSVASLFPSSEFVEIGGVTFNGAISASLSPTGNLTSIIDGMGQEPVADSTAEGESLSRGILGLQADASLGGAIVINLKATVKTPKVAAIGCGSSHPQWQFHLHDEPLHGQDLKIWSFVVLPKHRTELSFDAKFSLTHRSLFFPIRKESDWQTISCKLEPIV